MSYAPLQTVIPSYLYQEYSDDSDLAAFVAAYNTLAQGYLNWFNSTALAVYTSPNMTAPLLDWIAEGIYGISRPVFSSVRTHYAAGLNSLPVNVGALDGAKYFQSGTATIASDDYFKRFLTWWLYAGNGRNFNVEVLRLKVARWLYGINGTDITLAQAQTVHIQPQLVPVPPAPSLSSVATSGLYIEGETGAAVLGEPSDVEIIGDSPATMAGLYAVWLTYVNSIGETTVGRPSTITLDTSHVFAVASPPPANGAVDYNIYATILHALPSRFIAGVNSSPVNGYALNSSRSRGQPPPQLQNFAPVPIGTGWTEPPTGLVPGVAPPAVNTSNTLGNFIITLPAGTASTYLQEAFQQDLLAFPFQFTATVVVA